MVESVDAAEDRRLPRIRRGAFRAFFVYDVADTIDLASLRTVRGAGVTRAPLVLRREASSDFIQYPKPPLIVRLPDVEEPKATVRAKLFDYGVISIRLSVPFQGSWLEFAAATRRLRRDPRIENRARTALADVCAEIDHALDEPHEPLVEDYFIFEVEAFEEPVASRHLVGEYASELASLILSEEPRLTQAEVQEALRVSFSYFEDDLVVVQWDAAFVYERNEGAEAVEDILEFANTQLAEFRTYDARLDAELDAIYALEPGRSERRFLRRRSAQSAAHLRYLLVDVLELTDRTSNALKIIGDAYYARLYRGAAGRLGLADWQRQIDAKLRSVSKMYRVFQDQAQRVRSEFLEYVIIALIALEAVIGILALRH